jgi:DNA-binding response OmpR family regulator
MGCKVLFVGDDPDEGRLIELILTRNRGDGVEWMSDARQALVRAEQEHPDLIIIEFTLPEVDAFDICQQFRGGSTLRDIPILLWRVTVPRYVHARAHELGLAGYLPFPCGPEKLLAARDAAIGGGTFYPALD